MLLKCLILRFYFTFKLISSFIHGGALLSTVMTSNKVSKNTEYCGIQYFYQFFNICIGKQFSNQSCLNSFESSLYLYFCNPKHNSGKVEDTLFSG